MTLTPAQKVRLGAFLLVGGGLCVLSVGVLTGMRLLEPRALFRARFHESVAGLEQSAPVTYQGLRIGRVESMRIAADDPRAIEVVLALAPETRLYGGTQAVLDARGITGLKAINLTAGDPRKPLLAAGSLLPTGPSLFDRLTDNAASIVGDVKRVTDQLARMVTPDNRARLESLLGHLDRFVGNLDSVLTRSRAPVEDLLGEVRHTTAAIGDTAAAATHTLQGVRLAVDHAEQALVSTLAAAERPLRRLDPDEVARAVSAVRGAASAVQARLSVDEAGHAIAGFSDTVRRINDLVQDVDLTVRSGREDFTASLSNIRQAAEEMREFTRALAQNPSVLVRGRGDAD